jgi:protease-4
MKKFLLGLFVGLLLAMLSGIVLVFSVARLGERRPTIRDNSTLVLRLNGEIPEKPGIDVPLPFVEHSAPVTVRDTWSILKNAATDSRIKAILLLPDGVSAGWGKLEEIRADIVEFKKSGKPVYAFLRNPKTREYYLATAADRVYMQPEDLLDVKGLRAELMYFRRTLDKVGVQVEVMHIGKYKDAGDMFTNTTASPETLDVMNSVLDTVYGNLLETFGAARKKSADEMRAIIDNGPFTAKQALEKGLVDELRYEDQAFGELASKLGQQKIEKLSHREYLRSFPDTSGGRKKIAFLVGEGDIMRGSSDDRSISDEGFTSTAFIRQVRKVAEDNDVKGVIMRIDSPGGDAIASDEILREVQLLSKKKPLVISMSDLAASGGYYVAMTGDPIIAHPLTYTGSIGIIFGKVNLRGFYDKVGITKDILTRGKDADIDTDYRELDERGRQKLQESLQEFYTGFVGKAAASRKRTYDQLEPLAQGRVWMGSQAKANGLIDDLGGIDKAIELVKQKANIGKNEGVRLVSYPGKRSIFEQFLKANDESVVDSKMREAFGGLNYKLWMKGGIMRMMPYTIKIQ